MEEGDSSVPTIYKVFLLGKLEEQQSGLRSLKKG